MNLERFMTCAFVVFSTLLAVGEPSGSVAAAGRSEPASTSNTALMEERAARPPATSDLAEWVGVYSFSESPAPLVILEYRVVILDASGASLIIANGHMT